MNKLVILVLEDLVHDYELMLQTFSRSRIQFTAYRIENKKDFITRNDTNNHTCFCLRLYSF